MFRVEDRDNVRDRVLELGRSDPRVVSGAMVGSLTEKGDRWSDLDLAFAVADGYPVEDVLEEWTGALVDEFDAVHLVDLPSGARIYRVFLLPGCLQFDLSLAPAAEFTATSPRFKLLFGDPPTERFLPPPSAPELFGWAVHHALRSRFCIERGRYWQAEYWIGSLRDYALNLACLRRDLPARHARAFDDLPADVRDAFADSLAASLERDELLRALGVAVTGLIRVADGLPNAAKVAPQLRALVVL